MGCRTKISAADTFLGFYLQKPDDCKIRGAKWKIEKDNPLNKKIVRLEIGSF